MIRLLIGVVVVAGFTMANAQSDLRIIRPNGGEKYRLGDTITIEAEIGASMIGRDVVFEYSINDGKSFIMVPNSRQTTKSSRATQKFFPEDSIRVGKYDPELAEMVYSWKTVASTTCLVAVYDYNDNSGTRDKSDANFAILARSTGIHQGFSLKASRLQISRIGTAQRAFNLAGRATEALSPAHNQSASGVMVIPPYSARRSVVAIPLK